MWQHLQLNSLGVIESAELELESGFTVITGETGAGKTMVVTALGLLRGQRADLGLVRSGNDSARVEAIIGLSGGSAAALAVADAGGRTDDDTVVLGRVLSAQGRSRATAGGVTVPASLLTDVTDSLVAVHGQSDQHRLLKAAQQRAALDRFAGPELAAVLSTYQQSYAQWRQTLHELAVLQDESQQRAQELDLLRFGLAEVGEVEPVAGEDSELKTEESRLAHAESLARSAAHAGALIGGSIDDQIPARGQVAAAVAVLSEVAGHDPALDELTSRASEALVLLDDAATELAAYSEGIELDPSRLAAIQQRRADLASLQRKYGPGVQDVLQWAAQASHRLEELDHDDERISALQVERDRLEPHLWQLAEQLMQLRATAADDLAGRVNDELAQLSMPHAKLHLKVTREPNAELTSVGADRVEFLFSANSGMDPRPLHKGASGGELSRLMLALEVVLIDRSDIPTLVFDEVDAGIGGKAAVEVGRRLSRLAQHAQVLAVTHLPQVAAFADHHFVVDKQGGAVTRSSVVRLCEEQRVDELARMLAGQDESAVAQAHARELLALRDA